MPRTRTRRRLLSALALVLPAALVLTGCRGGDPLAGASASGGSGGPRVVAAFYPLQYAAERIGGSLVSVTNLTPAGAEPHDLEMSPQQVADVAAADVVLYVPGFQPALDEAISQQAADRAVDVTTGITLRSGPGGTGTDPHVWLDPENMAVIGNDVAARLSQVDPAHADTYMANLAAFQQDMSALAADYASGLKTCRTRTLVTSHEAFGYLAARYGLDQVAITGLAPDAEPSPARLRDIADLVKAKDVTTIYYETLVDPKVAEALASDTGTKAAVLDPLEGLTAGATGDYLSVMRQNLATLEQGQGCS